MFSTEFLLADFEIQQTVRKYASGHLASSHSTSLKPILILSSHLFFSLLSGLCPSGFPRALQFLFLVSHK
jgi:hypothetical protein